MSALQNPFVLFGYAGKDYFCDREQETKELISAYAVMDPNHTTFNMHFGNDNERDTQVYLVYNAMLSK